MEFARISSVEYYIPNARLDNAAIADRFPEWPANKILAKLGVASRGISSPGEYSSALAAMACRKLLARTNPSQDGVDAFILCTQTPDYLAPTTACLVQQAIGLPSTVCAFDINMGCSGYLYGLSVAKGFVESQQFRRVLLVTADTYTKFIDPSDKSLITLFGDGASATLIEAAPSDSPCISKCIYHTDGRGGENLIIKDSAARSDRFQPPTLTMNGPEVFNFTIKEVPGLVAALLKRESLAIEEVDLFVFHQANAYMLEHLRKKLRISSERFVIDMIDTGNTVSSTIPIALARKISAGELRPGMRLMLVGFGVGYSAAATLVRWS